MPGVRFARLLERFVASLEEAGACVTVVSGSARPAEVRVITQDRTTDCWVYLWTVTHGGATRAENEQRIQLTGVQDEIRLHPRRVTVLGGWSEDLGVYAFWDARLHAGPTSFSPSLQVRAEVLLEARTLGLATQQRGVAHGQETIVAVTRPHALWYVAEGRALHGVGDQAVHVPNLLEASIGDEDRFLGDAPTDADRVRRYEVVQALRPLRDARFRSRVLRAYRHRCAVCRCALRLVDAAHIIPVTEPDGTDDVRNGIALCRLHHGAYDNALLGVRSTYDVVINTQAAGRLRDTGFDAGLEEFMVALPARVSVPRSARERPVPGNLVRGLQVRQWPSELIA